MREEGTCELMSRTLSSHRKGNLASGSRSRELASAGKAKRSLGKKGHVVEKGKF